MSVIGDRETLFAVLQSDLEKYDRVILIHDRQRSGLCPDFCSSRAVKMSPYKILVLSVEERAAEGDLSYRQITEEEADRLYKLYHMYEFSDRFRVLSRETSHGSLFDYVELGILDMEEAFGAFLS